MIRVATCINENNLLALDRAIMQVINFVYSSRIFRELDKIWKNRYINLPTKMQFYNACVMSTLLYGAECWTLKDKDENRLDAFDMRCQRKILKIRWSQYVTNIDIRKKTNQPQLSKVIKKRRLQWFGHLQRMDVT